MKKLLLICGALALCAACDKKDPTESEALGKDLRQTAQEEPAIAPEPVR